MTKGKAELHAHSWANRANPKSQAQGKHSAFWPADSLVKLSGARKKSSDYEVNELLPVQMKLPHPTQTDLAFSPKPETRQGRVSERKKDAEVFLFTTMNPLRFTIHPQRERRQPRPGCYWTRDLTSQEAVVL